MFKDFKYNMQEATSNASFPWAEKFLNATDWFPLIRSSLVDAFPQAKRIFFFYLSAVTRLEDYFQMVIIWLSAARTTQFADVNDVGHVTGLGGVRKCASI